MSLVDFARSELERAGLFAPNSIYDGMVGPAVLKMVEQFAEEGHSGMSAAITRELFEKLARWEPIQPLTGEDAEWTEVSTGVFQNRRCSRVFKKGADGPAYDIDAVVFEEPNGSRYTSGKSRRFVTFPYTPATEVVKVPADAASAMEARSGETACGLDPKGDSATAEGRDAQ